MELDHEPRLPESKVALFLSHPNSLRFYSHSSVPPFGPQNGIIKLIYQICLRWLNTEDIQAKLRLLLLTGLTELNLC